MHIECIAVTFLLVLFTCVLSCVIFHLLLRSCTFHSFVLPCLCCSFVAFSCPEVEFFKDEFVRDTMANVLFHYAQSRPTLSYRQVLAYFFWFCNLNSRAILSSFSWLSIIVVRKFPYLAHTSFKQCHATRWFILFQGMHELLAPLIFVLHCDHQAFLHASEMEPPG